MVLIISIFYIVIENYNDQFTQYRNGTHGNVNVEGLINTVIENNENGRKVTIIYDNNSYTSGDELNQLLSILLNDYKVYSMNYDYADDGMYINSITLYGSNY